MTQKEQEQLDQEQKRLQRQQERLQLEQQQIKKKIVGQLEKTGQTGSQLYQALGA
jgi:hypothetical protein